MAGRKFEMYKVPAKLPLAWPIAVQVRGPTRPSRFTRDATRPGMADQPSSMGTGHSSKAQAPNQGSALIAGERRGDFGTCPRVPRAAPDRPSSPLARDVVDLLRSGLRQ